MSSYTLTYAATLTVTVGTSGVVDDGNGLFHKDFTVPAFKPASAMINQAVAQRRIGDEYGAKVKALDETTLRMTWFGDPGETEGLLNDESTGLDEIIAVDVEIFDLNAIGNAFNELLFRSLRILGYLGENVMQDLIETDDAGNVVQYRLRLFDTRAHCEAAKPDKPDGSSMQTGELARILMNQDIEISKNDRSLLLRVLTDVITTPGLT